jgi:O-phosphoseryl-tRNA(Cys) synthetase
MLTAEERYLEERLRSGVIPQDTSVIGIGVERLCMVVHGISDLDNSSERTLCFD